MAASSPASEFAAAAARRYAASEHEALRAVALAAATAGAAEAPALARAYAELCTTAFAPPVPLPWPQTHGRRRAAGRRAPPGSRERCREGARSPRCWRCRRRVRSHARDCRAQGARRGRPARECRRESRRAAVRARHRAREGAREPRSGRADRHERARRGGRAVPRAASGARDLVGGGSAGIARAAARGPDDRWRRRPRRRVDGGECGGLARERMRCPAASLVATWESGVRAHQRGDRDAARAAYAKVLEVQPEFAPAHYLTGILARDAGDAVSARRAFASALAAAPGYVDARLAAVACGDGSGTTSMRPSRYAPKGSPGSPTNVGLWRALGHAQLARRDGAAATEAFERALAIEPADGDTHYNLGVALQMRRSPSDAARAYRQALALAPGLLRPLQSRRRAPGGTRRRRGDRRVRGRAAARCDARRGVQEPGRSALRRGQVRRLARELPPLRGAMPGRAAARRAGARGVRSGTAISPASSGISTGCAARRSAPPTRLELVDCLEVAPLPAAVLRRRAGTDAAASRGPTTPPRGTSTASRCRARRRASPGGCASATSPPTCAIT